MSEFFTGTNIAQAMRLLHPSLVSGKDFSAVMGINEDGTPASDAWIERWQSELPEPSIDELKSAVAGMDLSMLPVFAPAPAVAAANQPTSTGLQPL